MDILIVVIITAAIQSLFGVGVLLFGTPFLLLLEYPFIDILLILLLISASINVLQVLRYYEYINIGIYKKVFLATQFLKSMEHNPTPTIPKVIDMYSTLKSGIYGIQMSEETVVGKYPKNCLDTIAELMDEINNEKLV
jgi:hypothetical protein